MRNFKKLGLIVCFLFIGYTTFAQGFSNRGREFWVGYGHHQFMQQGSNTQEMVIYLYTGDSAATVTIKMEGSGTIVGGPWSRTYNIPANTVISIEDPLPTGVTMSHTPASCPTTISPIPKGLNPRDCNFDARLFYGIPPTYPIAEGHFRKKGIHITSTTSIVAYAHIYGSVSSGATMLMPVSTWGYNYTSVNSDQNNADNAYSWMYIIANDDSTWVRITPSVPTSTGRPAGVPFDTVLYRGEIYQIIGQLTSTTAGYNLTGTTVRSINLGLGICHPVAVFSGSSRTGGEPPCSASQGGGRDNDMQQLFPEQAWGKRYLTAPFSNSNSPSSLMNCIYKVVVIDPTTVVKVNGATLTGLTLGKYYKFASSTADYIEADKPIMVAQFMGGGCVSNDGDPEMVYLSPIEQAIKDVGFYRNTKEAINTQYLTLIIPTNGVNTLKIDNTLFSAIPAASKHSYAHPNLPGYTVCIRRWNPATKAASTARSDSAFTAITYGEGGAESYGYNAGTFLKNLNALPFIKNELDTAKQSAFTCTGTSVEISALLAYKPTQIKWNLSQVKHLFRAVNNTPVLTDTITGNGSTLMVSNDSFYVNNRWYYKYPLAFYQFDSLGSFEIPITVKNPNSITCYPFEGFSLKIEVKQKPIADFTFIIPTCPTDTVYFSGAGAGGGYTIRGWFWEFPAGTPSADSSQNTGFVFVGPGSYPVKLTVASNEGCSTDTIKTINIPAGITTSFTVNPTTPCEGGAVTITPGPTTTTEWYWDYGDGNKDTLYNGNPFTHTYLGYGTFIISHSVKSSGTCNISALPQTVTVYANPFADFTITPPGCLPANGVVQFTSNAAAPDGQVINAHAWNFGDPNATGSNPNVSTLASPTHQYSVVGPYTIQYRATTVNGCFKDTTVNTVFNITPAVTYPALANVCLNTPPFNINSGVVTNGVPVTELYSGPGIVNGATGLFDPSIAGVGTHVIWYHATSTTGGCTDSVSQTITVNALPFASFTFPSTCLPNGNVQFTNNSTGGTTNSWDFGDGSPLDNTISPAHLYTGSGPYNVKLTVTGSGCSKDTTIAVTVRVIPQLSFTPLTGVCANAPAFAINGATVTNGVTGTGIYSGNGITNGATGTFDPALAGVGTHTITYVFTSSLSCIDSVSQTITVNNIPFASFTFPNNCLPNSTVQFTNNSTGGTIYSWDFGDGSPTVGTTSPSHTYAGSGPYNVKLTVSSSGCTKDTTIAVTVRIQPILNFPAITPVCANVPAFTLAANVTNGVSGTGNYSGIGITNGATGTFDPSIAGAGSHVIKYIFTSSLGCIDSLSQTIVVNAIPFASFTFPTNCLPNGNVQFTNNSTGGTTYSWDFGDGSPTVGTTSPTHTYAGSGPYNVKLTVTGSSCSKDTTIPVTVRIKPILSFSALTSVCANVPPFAITGGSVTNGVAGSGIYSGPGITNGATGLFNPALAGVGTHTIKYVFTSTLGCTDSLSQTIVVNAIPFASFTFPTICLPNGNVQFTNNSTGGTVYSWDFGDGSPTVNTTSPTHTYTGSGPYNVKLTATGNGCSKDTTIPVTVRIKPILSFSAINAVCANVPSFAITGGSVTNGVAGSGVYSGPGVTNGATGLFNPALAGVGTHTIKYIFTSTLGCIDSLTQTITVKGIPDAGFTFPISCLANGTVNFIDTSKVPLGVPSYAWNFGEPSSGALNVSGIKNAQHSYSSSGPFSVKLVVTVNGCADSVTTPVLVRVQPQLNFPVPASVCANVPAYSIATGTVINGVAGIPKYKGVGITDTLLGIFNPSIAGVGTHNITYYFTSTLGCRDSVTKQIIVRSVPVASFTYPTSCLGSNLVQFTNTSNPSTGATYSWNFGDPSSGANNTSNGASPTHIYNVFGTYSIKLTITANGCSDDTTINATFRLQPVINYPPLTAVCQAADTISVNTAVVTNGVPAAYPGSYSGVGVFDTTGLFNPLLAGYGTHTITFKFTSNGGCVATKTSTITVNPRPAITKIGFNNIPDTSICFNDTINISSQVLIGGGSITKWEWNLGDSTDTIFNANTVIKYLYKKDSVYKITLVTTSDKGCVSVPLSRLLYVRALPDAMFKSPSGVCMPNGSVLFENMSTIHNENVSTLKYVWSFGDGSAPSILTSPVHIYNTTLPQTDVILKVTSAYGCKMSDTATILFYPKPVADFTALPVAVCQGQPVTFTNTTTSSNITSSVWSFGDGSNPSTAITPVVYYKNYGEFLASLAVSSSNGCKDTASQKIRVYLQPVVDAGKSFVVNSGTVITLQGNVNAPGLTYSWYPQTGLNNAYLLNPTSTALANRTYTLTATGQGGCTDSDTMTVNILLALKIPNAFSPNGDGVNDIWDISNLKDYPASSVEVFNRYGQSVYLSNGRYTKSWDGTFKGNKLPNGTYYYIIDVKNGNKPIAGYVTIIK